MSDINLVKLAGEKSIWRKSMYEGPGVGEDCISAPPHPRHSIISGAESKRELEDRARGNVVWMRFSRQE